jgi:hypothetical protein
MAGLSMLVDGLTEHLSDMQSSPRNTVVLSILWAVLKSRNRMVFDRVLLPASQVALMAAYGLSARPGVSTSPPPPLVV